jgi:hypothetical protein
MCEIEQTCLLRSLNDFNLKLVAGLTKLSLDAASNGAEPHSKRREGYENGDGRETGESEIEAVKGLREKVIEASGRQYD